MSDDNHKEMAVIIGLALERELDKIISHLRLSGDKVRIETILHGISYLNVSTMVSIRDQQKLPDDKAVEIFEEWSQHSSFALKKYLSAHSLRGQVTCPDCAEHDHEVH